MKTTTELGLTYDQAKKYVERYKCADCGGRLTLAWGGAGIEDYVIRCGLDASHGDFGIPYEERQYNIETRRKFMAEDHGETKALALRKFDAVTVLDHKVATEMLVTLFPGADKASPAEFTKAVGLCVDYGLDPRTKDLYLLHFKVKVKDANGKVVSEKIVHETVRGISTSRKIARRKHKFSFIDNTPRYMTEEEEKRVYREINPDQIRYLVVLKDMETGETAPGYGQWSKYRYWTDRAGTQHQEPNIPKGVDKGNTPENMASIRAERQAIDRLYPMDMPSAVRVVEPEDMRLPVDGDFREVGADEAGLIVDTSTGEIIEEAPEASERELSNATEVKPGPAAAPASSAEPKQESVPESTVDPATGIDMAWLKETLPRAKWKESTAVSWIQSKFKITAEGKLEDILKLLTAEQKSLFCRELQDRADMA